MREEKAHGEHRTKRLVLEVYDAVARVSDDLVAGELPEVLPRLIAEFLPSEAAARSETEDLTKRYPLQAMIPTVHVRTEDGLARARTGSVEGDLAGHLIQRIREHMDLEAPFLSMALLAFRVRHAPGAEALHALLQKGALFLPNRNGILRCALDRYFAEDWISTTHILAPFIEDCLRRLVGALGGATDKPDRHDPSIYLARDLGDVLSEPLLKSFWERQGLGDIDLYLRVLLTEKAGWNLRNLVAHGLGTDELFDRKRADRLIHVLLLLLLLSLVEKVPEQSPGASGGQGPPPGVPESGEADGA